ncbi:MAG: hypothetical protein ACI9MR_001226 [Myxococcota bacterium]|jgi:hypothetical protein
MRIATTASFDEAVAMPWATSDGAGLILSPWFFAPGAVMEAAPNWLPTVLWAIAVMAFYAVTRRLAIVGGGALLAAVLLAIHPVGAAAHGDLAALWPLLSLTLSMCAIFCLLTPHRSPIVWLGGLLAMIAVLCHPIAFIMPVLVTADFLFRPLVRIRPVQRVVAAWFGVIVGAFAVVIAGSLPSVLGWNMLERATQHMAIVGRALEMALTGGPVVRVPYDMLDVPMDGWTHSAVLAGLLGIGGLLAVAAKVSRPGVRVGACFSIAVLIMLMQPIVIFASPLAPAIVVFLVVGLLWTLVPLVPERAWPVGVIGAVAAILVTLVVPRPSLWFSSEDHLTAHEFEALDGPVALRLSAARKALTDGRAEAAIAVLETVTTLDAVPLRVRAMLEVGRWADAHRLIKAYDGPRKPALRCIQAVQRHEVTAIPRCKAAFDALPGDTQVTVDLATAHSQEKNGRVAEELLEALVKRTNSRAAHLALADHYERSRWLREGVVALEAWHAAYPNDALAKERLSSALLNKVRGDLHAKRYGDAVFAARRLLVLDPSMDVVRYYLADALEASGEAKAAAEERARAKASGVEPPPAANAIPGVPAEMMPKGMR